MVSFKIRAQPHDNIVFTNNITVLSGALFTGTLDGGQSGISVNGPVSATKTNTAATSGPYAPLGYLVVQVSGQSVKVPYFTV